MSRRHIYNSYSDCVKVDGCKVQGRGCMRTCIHLFLYARYFQREKY